MWNVAYTEAYAIRNCRMMSGHLSALNAAPPLSIDGFLKQRERVWGREEEREGGGEGEG